MEDLRLDAVIAALKKAGYTPEDDFYAEILYEYQENPKSFESAYSVIASYARTLQKGCPPLAAPVDPGTRLWREYVAQNYPDRRRAIEEGLWDSNNTRERFLAAVKRLNATITIGDESCRKTYAKTL